MTRRQSRRNIKRDARAQHPSQRAMEAAMAFYAPTNEEVTAAHDEDLERLMQREGIIADPAMPSFYAPSNTDGTNQAPHINIVDTSLGRNDAPRFHQTEIDSTMRKSPPSIAPSSLTSDPAVALSLAMLSRRQARAQAFGTLDRERKLLQDRLDRHGQSTQATEPLDDDSAK